MSMRHIRGPLILNAIKLMTSGASYAMTNEAALHVNKTSGSATAVTLPENPLPGQVAFVKDAKGDAGANPITVTGFGGATIDGAASHVLSSNNAAAAYQWNGSQWALLIYLEDSVSGNVYVTGYLIESATDNITAHAGGGQASATQLASELNRVTTVASPGDSVVLPASKNGLTIIVLNHGANPVQVFGLGSDTIDDVAAATGVSQMQGSVTIYTCTTAGAWYSNGIGTGYAGSFPTNSYVNGLTAHAGGGQGAATPLTACLNRITTVASAGDSAILPASAGGMSIMVANAGANSVNVFPAVGESINALAVNTAFAVAAGKVATFYCMNAGQWHSLLSA